MLESLKEWEERLPDPILVRLQRSTIVNFEHVMEIEEGLARSFTVRIRALPNR